MIKNFALVCLQIVFVLALISACCFIILLFVGPLAGSHFENIQSNYYVERSPKPATGGPAGRYTLFPTPAPYPTPESRPPAASGSGSFGSFLSGSSGCLGFISSSYSSDCRRPGATRQVQPTPLPRPNEPLRAGEIDDNANWAAYLGYWQANPGLTLYNPNVSERYIIAVQDKEGRPVLNVTVRIFDTSSGSSDLIQTTRTVANGKTLFHPLALGIPATQPKDFQVEVRQADSRQTFTLKRSNQMIWPVTLDPVQRSTTTKLDILFLIDATGSMADEINKIQRTIFDVAARMNQLSGQASIHYGLVAYRDRGDSFITKTFDFTPNVTTFSANLNTIQAHAGGDYPESLNEGLNKALHHVNWRTDDTVRLVFLVADAPPHLHYDEDFNYATDMAYAAEQGIKIFTIASSGLDDQGEFIFRQLAQYTQARFIFLAYDEASGSGTSSSATAQINQPYSVANLDDLLVNLVRSELQYQNPAITGATTATSVTRSTGLYRLPGYSIGWLVLLFLLGGTWTIWGLAFWITIKSKFKHMRASLRRDPHDTAPAKPLLLNDPTLRDYVGQANDYNKKIKVLLGQSAQSSRLSTQIEAWGQTIASLAQQIDHFQENAVIHQDLALVPRAIRSLETQLAFETDPKLVPEVQRTLSKRLHQQGILTDLTRTMRQAELQLEHTLAALGTIYTQLVSGQSTHQIADYNRLLREIDEEVQHLEDYLEALREVKQLA